MNTKLIGMWLLLRKYLLNALWHIFQLIINSTLLCGVEWYCVYYLKIMAWHPSVAFCHNILNFVLNCALPLCVKFCILSVLSEVWACTLLCGAWRGASLRPATKPK